MAHTRMFPGLSFLSIDALSAIFDKTEPQPDPDRGASRREFLDLIRGGSHACCDSEMGAQAMMSLFPRDF